MVADQKICWRLLKKDGITDKIGLEINLHTRQEGSDIGIIKSLAAVIGHCIPRRIEINDIGCVNVQNMDKIGHHTDMGMRVPV